MNYSIVLYILGCVLKFESAFLVLPALVGLMYREKASVSYLAVAVLCLVLGVLLTHKKPRSTNLYTREGFVTVALSWIIMSIFGAIPFVLTGDIPFYVDALFETISGFTTTRHGSVCFYHGRSPFNGRFYDEPYESRKPWSFREQAGPACEGYRKNPLRHLYCHHDL